MDCEARDLSVARGGLRLLDGVSFRLAGGQALVLRGPNGIGKTTLLRTLAGLQPAAGGEISVPAEAIAYAGHADGIKATLTVGENLGFWARVYGTGALPGTATGDVALARMNLGALVDRPAQKLSAGQKRRLGLARLLVSGRPLWVLDEPTVSLDAASVALFVAAVRAHLETGGAVLVATHIDLGLAEAAVLDLAPFRAVPAAEADGLDGGFGGGVDGSRDGAFG